MNDLSFSRRAQVIGEAPSCSCVGNTGDDGCHVTLVFMCNNHANVNNISWRPSEVFLHKEFCLRLMPRGILFKTDA